MKGLSIFGLLIGVTVLAIAVALTAQEPLMFLNLPGLALVLGGTLAATLTSYSFREVWNSLRAISGALNEQGDQERSGLQDILRIKTIYDKDGVHAA